MKKFFRKSKLICLIFLLVIRFTESYAQTSEEGADSTRHWFGGVTPVLSFSQVSLSNWSGGGQNSMSFTGQLSAFLKYEKNRWMWKHNLDAGYGLSHIGADSTNWIKNEDKFIYEQKLAYTVHKHIKVAWLNDFRTQFADGYKYYKSEKTKKDTSEFVSTFLAPAYWTSAIGMEYDPSKVFSLFVSPLAYKMTIVNDDSLSARGTYGVTPYQTTRSEIGAMVNAQLTIDIMKNVIFRSVLNAYGDYETLDRIDIFWDNSLLMKVNNLITVSFTNNMIYDDDIKLTRGDGSTGPGLQYKHVLSVGISRVIGDQP